MTKKLFGGSESKSSSSSQGGYGALPEYLQGRFRQVADIGSDLIQNPENYFSPMGMTEGEALAGDMILPENFMSGISQYLNPFRDSITQDVNRQFEGRFDALNRQADIAGAFGGTGYAEGLYDVERARSDAVARAQADQFNQASNQMQTGISNLLSFGGFERGLDLAERQALPTALTNYMNIIQPLLGAQTSTGFSKSSSERGLTQGLGDLMPSSVPLPM